MTIQYMVAVANDSNRVIAVGIAGDQGGKDYPLQGEPKIGVWAPEKFDTAPECTEEEHIELIDGEIVVVDGE